AATYARHSFPTRRSSDLLITRDFLVQHMDEFELANPLDRKADVRLRMGLGCSLYMRDPQCPRTRLALARCADHYLDLVGRRIARSEEHTSELQSRENLVC